MRSTPTVHDTPHTGHTARRPSWIAATRARERRTPRQCADLHRPEQNLASTRAPTTSRSPH
ncbi:hypothetical protein ACFVYP_39305 [Kitasatospora sp. NPDC058201]|uniref:hypothetical protein n=1 Tax=unclassified Kitasatospora TaxID=2633591 RepID=UPI00365E99EA